MNFSQKITLNKSGVNLSMSWKHPSENGENNVENSAEKPSVIKKLSLGLPVGKLVNSPDPHQELPAYMNRMPQMQSILTIRPDQFRQTPTPQNPEIPRNSVIMTHEDPVKANSIESPPEKSDEELIEPGSPDKPFVSVIQPNENGKETQMDVDGCGPQGGCCGPQGGCGDHKVKNIPFFYFFFLSVIFWSFLSFFAIFC